jgi:hypothetical protein
MAKYIGTDAPYGLHEKQIFELEEGKRDFLLAYRVGYSTSVLVVYQIAGASKILEPGHDYDLIEGGTKIRINFETYNSDAYEERLYAIYLGKQLSIPVPLEKRPVLIQKTGATGNITVTDVVLESSGLIIFKNNTQLRHLVDYEISSDGTTVELTTPAISADVFDLHVFSGLQRSGLVPIENNSVTAEHLKDNIISSNKLDLRYVSYSATVSGIGTLQTTLPAVLESSYIVQGNPASLNGAPVKVRIKFTTTLAGIRDTCVRFSLPNLIPNASTVIGGNVTITNSTSIESGILTWGATNAIDIRRQFGVTFDLGFHTFEAVLEYITKQ